MIVRYKFLGIRFLYIVVLVLFSCTLALPVGSVGYVTVKPGIWWVYILSTVLHTTTTLMHHVLIYV